MIRLWVIVGIIVFCYIVYQVRKIFKPVVLKHEKLFDQQIQSDALDTEIDVVITEADNKKLEKELKNFEEN